MPNERPSSERTDERPRLAEFGWKARRESTSAGLDRTDDREREVRNCKTTTGSQREAQEEGEVARRKATHDKLQSFTVEKTVWIVGDPAWSISQKLSSHGTSYPGK